MVLVAAYQMRRSNLQEVTVDGKHLWCFLAPTIAKADGQAVVMSALFYQEYPKHGLAPVEKGGDPAPERELAVRCRQRIEILKHILAALKQEAAQR